MTMMTNFVKQKLKKKFSIQMQSNEKPVFSYTDLKKNRQMITFSFETVNFLPLQANEKKTEAENANTENTEIKTENNTESAATDSAATDNAKAANDTSVAATS